LYQRGYLRDPEGYRLFQRSEELIGTWCERVCKEAERIRRS
jgi:hypothetical protein